MTLAMNGTSVDLDRAIEEAVESEIREFVQRDSAGLRRAPEGDSELVANNIVALLQRVAGSSLRDIDRLITELQMLREILQQQGARVQRDIAEYAHLSQSSMQSTKIIAEGLARWKKGGDGLYAAPH